MALSSHFLGVDSSACAVVSELKSFFLEEKCVSQYSR